MQYFEMIQLSKLKDYVTNQTGYKNEYEEYLLNEIEDSQSFDNNT